MDVEDDFWGELDQIEDAERTGRSGRPSVPAPLQGSGTAALNRALGATREVITLDDEESEPDDWIYRISGNKGTVSHSQRHRVTPPPVPSSQPRHRHKPKTQVQEVIDLSD